jgi:hypothetical protein
MKDNVIETEDVQIIITACDVDWARIMIFDKHIARRCENGRQLSCRVSIPGFTREFQRHYPSEMTFDAYDHHLKANRDAILGLVDGLNKQPSRASP